MVGVVLSPQRCNLDWTLADYTQPCSRIQQKLVRLDIFT